MMTRLQAIARAIECLVINANMARKKQHFESMEISIEAAYILGTPSPTLTPVIVLLPGQAHTLRNDSGEVRGYRITPLSPDEPLPAGYTS